MKLFFIIMIKIIVSKGYFIYKVYRWSICLLQFKNLMRLKMFREYASYASSIEYYWASLPYMEGEVGKGGRMIWNLPTPIPMLGSKLNFKTTLIQDFQNPRQPTSSISHSGSYVAPFRARAPPKALVSIMTKVKRGTDKRMEQMR